jgi:hypothetical protein
MLEAFSRTVRNYVPTSIPIPNAAPSPPRVSRPVSFGSFMISGSRSGNARLPADTDQSNTSQRRASRSGERAGGRGSDPRASDVFVSDDEDEVRGSGYGHVTIPEMATYPSPTHCDPILWARWDLAEVHGIMARYVHLQ